MYTHDGRWIERDDSEPTRRTHCQTCGGFLPKVPAPSYRTDPATGQQETTPGDYLWTCGKCGRDYDSEEMFT